MVYGVGIDIVNIARMEKALLRWEQKIWNRLFSSKEQEECSQKKRCHQSMAGKFAAKEAILKALGTGLSHGISWKQMEILEDKSGRPQAIFSSELKIRIDKMGIKNCFISIAHEADYAIAQAILLKVD